MKHNICLPAFIYLLIMLPHIVIDIIKKDYNLSLLKIVGTLIIVYLLEIICKTPFYFISYFLIFVPLLIITLSNIYLYIVSTSSIRYFSINNNIIDRLLYDNNNLFHGYESFK